MPAKRTTPVVKFRVVKHKVPMGNLAIESNKGGAWQCVMIGLDKSDVEKQFRRLEKAGAIIVR